MKEQSTIYADIVKVETKAAEPNFRYVHARISDETKDLDGQTADYDWLKTALPDWFQWGNVRDMHENNVIGKAKELTDVPSERGFDGVLKVVDPVAVIKVDEGLFTGVSVGIKGPRVVNTKGATVHPHQPGRIVAGKIVEVSLVDHPCNENCKLTVAKAAGKKLDLVKGAQLEIIERSDDDAVSEFELETYKKRFDPILAKAGVALSDGSYVITTPTDLMLAKALRLTEFGNVTAADLLIKRRETEFKAAGKTQQPTPDQAKHPVAPGARENRDNPEKGAPPVAKNPDSKNPDKESPAHQSPDASGSSAAFDASDPSVHPPTKAKKKKGKNHTAVEVDPHTHGDDTGSVGTQTDTSKGSTVKQKTKTTTKWKSKFASGDPAAWSDKKLAKAVAAFKNAEPDLYKTATSSYTGDGRPLLEQIAREMQGRIYSVADVAQGSQTQDNRVDKAEDTGNDDLLNSGSLMQDGQPRVNANTPQKALAQSGPMNGGNSTVSSGGDTGVPNTAHPFDSAPQQGADRGAVSPGGLPGSLSAPGDTQYVSKEGGAPGQAGEGSAAPSMSHPTGVAQRGTDANAVGARSAGSANTAFAFPTKKAAKADKKKRKAEKAQKKLDKLAKAAVADRVEAAVPDSTKAVIAGILKKFSKDLEKNILTKYATADQLKDVQSDIEKLGAMAKPGGPFVGQIVAVDKIVTANEFAQPETTVIEPDILEKMERYERLSKSDNRQLAGSAQVELKKLLDTHFPAEVSAELTKRRRSAAR